MGSQNLGRLKYPEYCRTAIGRCWVKQKSKRRTSCPCTSTNEMHINSHPASTADPFIYLLDIQVYSRKTLRVSSKIFFDNALCAACSSRPNRGSSTLCVACCGSILFNFEYGIIINDRCNEFGKKENQTSLNQGYNSTVTCTKL